MHGHLAIVCGDSMILQILFCLLSFQFLPTHLNLDGILMWDHGNMVPIESLITAMTSSVLLGV